MKQKRVYFRWSGHAQITEYVKRVLKLPNWNNEVFKEITGIDAEAEIAKEQFMEFDKSRVFTCVNAEEVKIGSKVIIADSLGKLKRLVELGDKANIHKLIKIYDCNTQHRFRVDNGYNCEYALCYLVEEPAGLKWTDLKIGDVIRKGIETYMVIGIEDNYNGTHILAGQGWLSDSELEEWEKVE